MSYTHIVQILKVLTNDQLYIIMMLVDNWDYNIIMRMSLLLHDMVVAWMRREDNVLKASGNPTWTSLRKGRTKT